MFSLFCVCTIMCLTENELSGWGFHRSYIYIYIVNYHLQKVGVLDLHLQK